MLKTHVVIQTKNDTISTGLGVPGLSTLRDLANPLASENEPDLFRKGPGTFNNKFAMMACK